MFILKKGHQPGVYVPLRALFLVLTAVGMVILEEKIVIITEAVLTSTHTLCFRAKIRKISIPL